MKITKITLENFKNYTTQTFQFVPGTIAICGPNGSGKSSIIEAISWVLFDFIPYKKDIIKVSTNGNKLATASKEVAKVQVNFISDLNEKEYTVSRNTKGNYFVIDLAAQERVAENKREVIEFLKKHYNLPLSSNLGDIFKHTTGVPQGMLTSIFLETPINRQQVFDKVLNLEDYRKTYEQLKDFKAYIKDLTVERQNNINIHKSKLENISNIQQHIEKLDIDINQNTSELEKITKTISDYIIKIDELNNSEKSFNSISNNIEQNKISINHIKRIIIDTENNYLSCKDAYNELNTIKPSHDRFNKLKEELIDLEKKKNHLDILNKDLIKEEKQLDNIVNQINNNKEKQETNEKLKKQIKELEPQAKKQEELETNKQNIKKLLDKYKENKSILTRLQSEKKDYTDQIEFLDKELSKINDLKETADKYNFIKETHLSLNKIISELQSNLNQHKKMSLQVKGGLCPFLNECCKNIEGGQDLNTYFKIKIEEIETKLNSNTTEFKNTDIELKKAHSASEEYNKLLLKQEDRQKIVNKLEKIEQDINNTEIIIDELKEVPNKSELLDKEYNILGSPKHKIEALNQQLVDESILLKNNLENEKNKTQIENNISLIRDKINKIEFNELEYDKLKVEKNQLEKYYQRYLKLEERSKKLEYYEKQLKDQKLEEKEKTEILNKLEDQLKEINNIYNTRTHKEIKDQFEKNQIQKARLEEHKKNILLSREQLNDQIEELNKLKALLVVEEEKLEEINNINNFIDISRDIYRNCGPKIGQFYIENISSEANILYKDITSNENQDLKWEMDYEIIIEESGVKRSFTNLSGGEQMSASLAIRLSLLRELSDINIAFFDEPTANMDETRRLNLAEQIKKIKSFDQLFIISHDDTFEKDIDYVIRLG